MILHAGDNLFNMLGINYCLTLLRNKLYVKCHKQTVKNYQLGSTVTYSIILVFTNSLT